MSDVIIPENICCVCCRVGLAGGGEMPSFLTASLPDVTALRALLGIRMSLRLCAGLLCYFSSSRASSFLAFQHVS